jgi:separase
MASGLTTRRANSTRQPTRPKKTVLTDKLVEQLDSGLTIYNGKGQKKSSAVLSDEEVRLSAMRSVNSASQGLSTAVQSGWKRSSEITQSKSSSTLSNVTASDALAAEHLAVLRTMCPNDLDVERAAMSVFAKLVSLEMASLWFLR